jgi:hypothetical protein
MAAEPRVWVFFSGSYMNFGVLSEVNLIPPHFEVATLAGFDISIRPRANLIASDQHRVYGIVTTATHSELQRLYAHAKEELGETYLPQAVLTEGLDGKWRPALCYIAPAMEPRPATADYVDRIVAPANEFGFPRWYIQRLESFRPK